MMPSWRDRALWLLAALLVTARLIAAMPNAHSEEKPSRTKGESDNSDEHLPLDEDFLEFLGDWETATGDWIDPEELAALIRGKPKQPQDGKGETSDENR